MRVFGSLKEVERDPWLSLRPRLHKHAIARIDFLITDISNTFGIQPATEPQLVDLLAFGNHVTVVPSNEKIGITSMKYYVVPPVDARSFRDRPFFSRWPGLDDKAVLRADQRAWLNDVNATYAKWCNGPGFVGFYGTWTIYITNTSISRQKERSDKQMYGSSESGLTALPHILTR